ncbi:MAG: metalloregulator ArsR/SmtB family transcription factor [Syntrophobacteraceae bacterium]|nr:metalloregulator ArsR/SmtB family transcription factor [Syntrophobacteraceae bacterium]
MSEQNTAPLLIDAEQIQRAADILKTVAHPARLRIIDFLEPGEQPVANICKCLNAPQPFISHHLGLMKAKGILVSRRNGNQVFYSVANKSVIEVIHCVRKHGPDACMAESARE